MNLTPFDTELLLLGHVLRYGEDAARLVLPALSSDRFIYSKEGQLNAAQDHMRIWQAITLTFLHDKMSPSVAAVLGHFEGQKDFASYLKSLTDRLSGYYRIEGCDPQYVRWLAEQVDRNGLVYRAAHLSSEKARILESPETFAKAVTEIEDVDTWINDHVRDLAQPIKGKVEGFRPVSVVGSELLDKMAKWQAGEQNFLLPTGLPSMDAIGLYRAGGHLIIQHGRSHSGKSAWTHLVQLGTAIGLKNNGIKGCVAINSLEEDQHGMVLKLGGILAGVKTNKLKFGGGLEKDEYRRLCDAVNYVSGLPLFIESSNIVKATSLGLRLNGLHSSEHGPVWMMSVDYLELLARGEGNRETKEQMVEATTRHCHDFSRDTGACVVLISQSTQGETGKFNIAGVDGTRYSRGVYMTADSVVELWNPVFLKAAMVNFAVPEGLNDLQPWMLIEKDKHFGLSSPIPLGWEPEYIRFRDPRLEDWRLFSHDIPYFGPARDEGGF